MTVVQVRLTWVARLFMFFGAKLYVWFSNDKSAFVCGVAKPEGNFRLLATCQEPWKWSLSEVDIHIAPTGGKNAVPQSGSN